MPRTVLNKEDKVKPEKKDKGEHLSAKSSASRAPKRKKSKRYFSSSSGDSESDSSSSDSSSRSSGSSASSSSFSSSDVERKKKKKRQRQKSKIKSKSLAKQSRKASASRTPALSMPLPVPAPSAELAASPKQPTFEIWSPVDGEKQQKQRKSSSHRHHGHKSSSHSSQDNKHRSISPVDGEKQQQQRKSSSHRHHENKSSRRSSQENKHRIISHAVSSCKSLTDADGSDQPAKEQEDSNAKDQEQAVKVVKLDEVKLKSEVFKERAMNMMERSSAAQGTEKPRDKDRKGDRYRDRDRDRERERSSTSSRSMSQRSHRGRSRYRRSPFSNNGRNNYHPNEQQLRKVRLYIKGLSPQVTKAHIVEIFGSFGPLTNVDFPIENYGQGFNRKTGRGYAFCEFQNPRDCARARRHMNGGKIDGKQILVVPFQARKLNLSLRRRRPSPYTNYRY
ncbi:RNA-binding protein with serine-rich domain 1 [Drosophila albomicans]|uniref:RNA-binding protein with serine-rich domain 1 n=1 Tax=Drosophila albomicans TaxID=7291 RepID=A0A6P8XAP4_DROAB|nr:RNA-binding protein with serine-rich domain 1 [Drosophila albomicans]